MFGLKGCPQQWGQPCTILCVDLCTQSQESIAHARLVAEDGVHEGGAASMVPVIHPILDRLSHDNHMIVT